jgi:RNA polymerase sigma-70 factor (ECF subfamily)
MLDSEEINIFNRIKNDDKQAFNILFEEYYGRLCEFSYRIIANKQLSEEIVADVFAKIWIKRHQIEITGSIRAYLFQSTKNTTLSYLRKRKKETVNFDDLINFQFKDESNPEKELIRNENLKSYENILSVIPEKSRAVFIMHRFDQLKYREISSILGISQKTVEKHMGKAIKLMREYKKNMVVLTIITASIIYFFTK